jgi:hypothetical protein
MPKQPPAIHYKAPAPSACACGRDVIAADLLHSPDANATTCERCIERMPFHLQIVVRRRTEEDFCKAMRTVVRGACQDPMVSLVKELQHKRRTA